LTQSHGTSAGSAPSNPAHGQKSPPAQKAVSAEEGDTLSTLKNLWPYIWPSSRPDLKKRVLLAVVALVVAKFITVLSPYFFAWATDVLAGEDVGLPAFLLAPVMLVLAYNAARVMAVAFNQLRDALFARVGQHAVRQLAKLTFRHLHQLSLRFHLARRTGGLSRVIERGVKGIESIVRFTILNGFPTVLEFALMAGVIWFQFGFAYVVIVAVMIVAYVWFTIKASNWRIAIRREMNDSDTDANSKAIDSLLNFETVKYFRQ
jgi:ABC-type multidrug transport system fused ATPase/permease subunit